MSWEEMMVRMCIEDYDRTERKRKMMKVKKWCVAIVISLLFITIGFVIGMIVFGG